QKLPGHGDGNPEIGAEDCVEAFEVLRADADDRERKIVEFDCLSDDVRASAEATLPGGIAENGNGGHPELGIFVWQEKASLRWIEAEGVEIIGGNEFHENAVRLAFINHSNGHGIGMSGEAGEGVRSIAKVAEVGEGKQLEIAELRGLFG